MWKFTARTKEEKKLSHIEVSLEGHKTHKEVMEKGVGGGRYKEICAGSQKKGKGLAKIDSKEDK